MKSKVHLDILSGKWQQKLIQEQAGTLSNKMFTMLEELKNSLLRKMFQKKLIKINIFFLIRCGNYFMNLTLTNRNEIILFLITANISINSATTDTVVLYCNLHVNGRRGLSSRTLNLCLWIFWTVTWYLRISLLKESFVSTELLLLYYKMIDFPIESLISSNNLSFRMFSKWYDGTVP